MDDQPKVEVPAPDPKKPWALNHNDRWFLEGLKIDPERATTPYENNDHEADGA